MDATTEKCPQDKSAAYTTSKQVQAWFLGRSRDLWKKKYAELKVESKRLHQRVADVCKSRDNWRSEVETTQRELRELHVQNAELQARLDAIGEDASQKKRPIFPPSLTTRPSRKFRLLMATLVA